MRREIRKEREGETERKEEEEERKTGGKDRKK